MTDDRAGWLRALRPYAIAARHMQGWAFDYEPVPLGPPPPWDYAARAELLLGAATSAVDLGTGGGEFFAARLAAYSGRAVATEAWGPNVPVAAQRLAPLGVPVVHADSLRLPFAAAAFDLVLDRHEELAPAEVARVLRPGGTVLSQQVHPDEHAELRAYFPRMAVYEPHHETYPAGFQAAGLSLVTLAHHTQPVAYRHIGELAYLFLVAPWMVPGFDLEADLEALIAVDRDLRGPHGIALSYRRYLLEARKPD
jgi:SAM-dependent methyltransferase